ncbi:MAG: hypothetical protein AMS23_01370 [Bacteroides sp. SM1_62]|nr:MAG: hypothetical protein AMS23_01370 [Bacteroides sp. SM1_62]
MEKVFKLIGKKRFFIMLALALSGCVLITVAAIMGVSDNLPGILLCYAGIVSLIFAFIHHWRKSKGYVILLVSSIIGFIVFAILHNVLEAMGVEIIGAVFFLIALFVCPPAFFIGLVGTLITGSRK